MCRMVNESWIMIAHVMAMTFLFFCVSLVIIDIKCGDGQQESHEN